MMAEFAPYLLIPFFLFWIFGVIWSGQRKKPQAEEESKAGEGETHQEALRRILGELDARLEEGELEEVLVYYSLKTDNAVHRVFSFRTGHTLHCIKDIVDEWARLRRAEQN